MDEKETKKRPRISLRFKWTFFITIVVFFMYVIFAVTNFYFVSHTMMKNEQVTVKNAVDATISRFEEYNQPLNKETVKNRILVDTKNSYKDTLVDQLKRNDLQIVIADVNNKQLYETKNYNIPIEKTSELTIKEQHKNNRLKGLVGTAPIKSKQTGKIIGYVSIYNNIHIYHETINSLLSKLLPNAFFVLVASIFAGYVLVGLVLRRIRMISKTIKSINESPESEVRIPKQKQNDELSDVAEQFNSMLDRLQQYTNQQKEFVQDVSHELRTPVAVLEGHLQLLNRWGKDDPEVLEESLQSSLQEVSRMKHMIQEMLDLTRLEQDENQYADEVTDAKPIILQIYNDFKTLHPDFKITLDYDVREDAQVKIYRSHLEQIIIILMDNATKYSDDKKEIYMSVSRSENYLEIAVQDFGVGISTENQEKIFNRFYRADKDRSRASGGTGLGLPIAKQLVKNYKGFMYVESIVGSGSVFKIELPIVTKKD